MALAELTDPTAVSGAMDESDRLGRDAFLESTGSAALETTSWNETETSTTPRRSPGSHTESSILTAAQ